MLLCLWVSVLLGHSEIDNVDDIGRLGTGSSDQEVVGFDVAVNEVPVVYSLHS